MLFVPPISMKASRVGIARFAEALPPAANALDGEGGGIGIDPDIDPALVGGDVVDPIGRHLPQSLDFEVVDPHRLGVTLATQFATSILEIPDKFFFLGVDRDRRFAGRDRGLHRGIDVFELRIAVGMLRALAGLAVGLTAVFQRAQQLANHLLADFEALSAQRRGKVTLTAADPAQRRLRIAAGCPLDQLLERFQKARLTINRTLASTSRPPDTIRRLLAATLQFGDAAIDRAARNPRRCRNRRHPTVTKRRRLVGCNQPTPALVQEPNDPLKSRSKRVDINHRERVGPGSDSSAQATWRSVHPCPQDLANQGPESCVG
jgi:hypothetical protein